MDITSLVRFPCDNSHSVVLGKGEYRTQNSRNYFIFITLFWIPLQEQFCPAPISALPCGIVNSVYSRYISQINREEWEVQRASVPSSRPHDQTELELELELMCSDTSLHLLLQPRREHSLLSSFSKWFLSSLPFQPGHTLLFSIHLCIKECTHSFQRVEMRVAG